MHSSAVEDSTFAEPLAAVAAAASRVSPGQACLGGNNAPCVTAPSLQQTPKPCLEHQGDHLGGLVADVAVPRRTQVPCVQSKGARCVSAAPALGALVSQVKIPN